MPKSQRLTRRPIRRQPHLGRSNANTKVLEEAIALRDKVFKLLPAEPDATHPLRSAPASTRPMRRKPSRPGLHNSSNFRRHSRKCAICRHPRREDIEEEFLQWHPPANIQEDYDLPSRSAIYRHAQATGLRKRRRRNLRGLAERILENADVTRPSGETILRAMRIYAHITEDGEWIEPAKRTVVHHIHSFAPRTDSTETTSRDFPLVPSEPSLSQLAEPRPSAAPPNPSPAEVLIGTLTPTDEPAND